MKVNQTPYDDGGNRIVENFPPIEVIQRLEEREFELKTFELMTFEKDHTSPKNLKCSANSDLIKNIKQKQLTKNLYPNIEIVPYVPHASNANSVVKTDDLGMGELNIDKLIKDGKPKYHFMDNNTDERLVKKQNEMIKSLSKEIEKLKSKFISLILEQNKSSFNTESCAESESKFEVLKHKNLVLEQQVSELKCKLNKMGSTKKSDQAVGTETTQEEFNQRKDLIEFLYMNEAKMILLSSSLVDIIVKIIASHPGLETIANGFKEKERLNKLLNKTKTINFSKAMENDHFSILEESQSVLDSYDSGNTFDK
jgi:hypothetical protein